MGALLSTGTKEFKTNPVWGLDNREMEWYNLD